MAETYIEMQPPEYLSPRRRLWVPLPVETELPQVHRPRFLGYVENLSETGAFVQSSNPRPYGSSLSMLLHLPGAPAEGLRCEGEVIWSRGYGGVDGPCPGMGVRFTQIPECAQAFLYAFCRAPDPTQPSRQRHQRG